MEIKEHNKEQSENLYKKNMAESCVKAVKFTMNQLLRSTLIEDKPTLIYAPLCTLLTRAASIVNDRPVVFCYFTEEQIAPFTVNQLLLVRSTTTGCLIDEETAEESYMAADTYQEELITKKRNKWKVQSCPTDPLTKTQRCQKPPYVMMEKLS